MIRRLRRPAPYPANDAPLHTITSILFQYPDDRVRDRLDAVTAALPAITNTAARDAVAGFTEWLTSSAPSEAVQHYVATFDHTRRRSLYLTYYRYGDTRTRGMALLSLKHVYRAAGYPPPETELPDFLPLVLEFAAVAPEAGRRVLIQCRAGLELLADALHEAGTPYAGLVDAVRTGLPGLAQRDRDALHALAADGPPSEQVGLEPFAPPEYVTGGRR